MSIETEEIPEFPRGGEPDRDGIAEEDHKIPLWFNLSFAGTIVFALIYTPYYLFSGWSQTGQWEAEVAAAEERRAAVVASLPDTNPYRGDAAAIAAGEQVYLTTCVACHKPDGSGLVGPSLVDPYWKYGDADADLFETVSEGRPAGMPPWGSQLGNEKIWQVLAYIETLPKSEAPGVGAPDYQPTGG